MRVLSVVHDPTPAGGGGLFERAVVERGGRLDRWVAPNGDAPSEGPRAWDAIMVFGGTPHPDQDSEHPWLPGEVRFIERALDDRVPLIGVCLGAQLVARAAGAAVGLASHPEVGWVPVTRHEAADDPVFGVVPPRFDAFQWHYYTYELPTGAIELASSDSARQAFRLGDRVWAMQFHAEVDRLMLDSWLVDGADELPKPQAEMRAETDAKLPGWNAHGRALCNAFLDEAKRIATATHVAS